MQTHGIKKNISGDETVWIPFSRSIIFLLGKKRLVGLSLLLFLATIAFTWVGYYLALEFVDSLTQSVFVNPPDASTITGWLKHAGWQVLKWFYLIFSRIVAFYLAFLLAYSLTTPGYVLLSTTAERIQAGENFEMDDGLTLRGILLDLIEGIKIAGFGILVTIAAVFVNFIPVIGQVLVLLLYTYYSALMFLDYPASRRRWSLGKKLSWLRRHSGKSLRLGILPALVSMIPLLNIFLMSLLFPFLTVHATLNFTVLESSSQLQKTGNGHAA